MPTFQTQMQALPRAPQRWQRPLIVVAILAALIGGGINYVRHTLTKVYGWSSVSKAVVAYMQRNDSRWPRSWDDLKPHLDDSFDHELLVKYWGVAWTIDPVRLYREAPCKGDESLWPIYSREKHPGPTAGFCFPPPTHGTMNGVEHLLRQRKLIDERPRNG